MSLEEKVKAILVEVVHQVRPESSAREAASIMVKNDVGCLVVSGLGGPIGMVTERDLLREVVSKGADPGRVRVADIMSLPLISATMDTSIGDAAKKMTENHIKRLTVMGEDGTFLGLVTMTDIVRWMAKQKELSEALIDYINYDVP